MSPSQYNLWPNTLCILPVGCDPGGHLGPPLITVKVRVSGQMPVGLRLEKSEMFCELQRDMMAATVHWSFAVIGWFLSTQVKRRLLVGAQATSAHLWLFDIQALS